MEALFGTDGGRGALVTIDGHSSRKLAERLRKVAARVERDGKRFEKLLQRLKQDRLKLLASKSLQSERQAKRRKAERGRRATARGKVR